MKNQKLFSLLTLSLVLLFSCTNPPKSDEAKTTEAKEETSKEAGTNYKVDKQASHIEWIGTKVSGYHTGTVNIKNGELIVSGGNITGGNFTIDMSSIVASGPPSVNDKMSAKLTGHLHSPEFFDVRKFPEASFVITGIKPFSGTINEQNDPREEKLNEYKVPDPTHMVSGNLTIKEITKNIEFPAKITLNDNSVEARAKFNIDRKQWNITYPGQPDDLIRDEIHLGIFLKAQK